MLVDCNNQFLAIQVRHTGLNGCNVSELTCKSSLRGYLCELILRTFREIVIYFMPVAANASATIMGVRNEVLGAKSNAG